MIVGEAHYLTGDNLRCHPDDAWTVSISAKDFDDLVADHKLMADRIKELILAQPIKELSVGK